MYLENIPLKVTIKKNPETWFLPTGQQKQCQGAFHCVLDDMIAKLKSSSTSWSPLLSPAYHQAVSILAKDASLWEHIKSKEDYSSGICVSLQPA